MYSSKKMCYGIVSRTASGGTIEEGGVPLLFLCVNTDRSG